VYNLRPLNSPTRYLFIIINFNASINLHMHTKPLFQVEMEKDGWEQVECFVVRVPRTLNYPAINLNPC